MKSFIYIFSVFFMILASCATTDVSECGEMICTQEFRMVTVRFSDESGRPVIVKNFSSKNMRTGRSTVQNNDLIDQGNYVLASDADRKDLSESGDIILVSATNPKTNITKEAEFVVSGGLCACHINKISGPDKISF